MPSQGGSVRPGMSGREASRDPRHTKTVSGIEFDFFTKYRWGTGGGFFFSIIPTLQVNQIGARSNALGPCHSPATGHAPTRDGRVAKLPPCHTVQREPKTAIPSRHCRGSPRPEGTSGPRRDRSLAWLAMTPTDPR
jgi:hypothetical protein